jgi:anti-anti-sigma factor
MSTGRATQRSAAVVVELTGRLTAKAEGTLGNAVDVLLGLNCKKIVLSLRYVSQVDCAGIGQLVGCYLKAHEQGATLYLLRPSSQIRGLLRLFQLDQYLKEMPPPPASSTGNLSGMPPDQPLEIRLLMNGVLTSPREPFGLARTTVIPASVATGETSGYCAANLQGQVI